MRLWVKAKRTAKMSTLKSLVPERMELMPGATYLSASYCMRKINLLLHVTECIPSQYGCELKNIFKSESTKYIHKNGKATGKLRVNSMSASQLASEHPSGPISVPQLGADSSTTKTVGSTLWSTGWNKCKREMCCVLNDTFRQYWEKRQALNVLTDLTAPNSPTHHVQSPGQVLNLLAKKFQG